MRRDKAIVSTAFRYFAATAEAGSIRAAARELNIASSAINRQILKLEDEIGLKLFERVGRGLALTEEGELLLGEVQSALRGYEAALDAVDALHGLQRGRVRLATVESVSVEILPRLLAAFGGKYPAIRIELTVTGSEAVASAVQDGKADLGFTFNPPSLEGLDVALEMPLQIGVIMSPAHALAGSEQLELADCLEHSFAWPDRGLSLRVALDRAAQASELAVEPALVANSLRVMANLARSGRCLGFQTPVGIGRDLATGDLLFKPLADKALPKDRLMLICQAGRTLPPAAQALFEAAREELSQL